MLLLVQEEYFCCFQEFLLCRGCHCEVLHCCCCRLPNNNNRCAYNDLRMFLCYLIADSELWDVFQRNKLAKIEQGELYMSRDQFLQFQILLCWSFVWLTDFIWLSFPSNIPASRHTCLCTHKCTRPQLFGYDWWCGQSTCQKEPCALDED